MIIGVIIGLAVESTKLIVSPTALQAIVTADNENLNYYYQKLLCIL